MAKVNFDKHISEGWTVGDFIRELEPQVYIIQSGRSFIKPFQSKDELKKWCKDNQPYFKKHIPGVVNYFSDKYNIK